MDQHQQMLQLKAGLVGLNLDANETALLQRQLTYVETQTYQTQYPELRHRRYIPQDTSVPAGAESIVYRMYDRVQNAKLVADYADDIPFADVIVKETPIPIKTVASAFQYSLRDLEHAAFSGVPLDTLRAQAARDSIEFELDDIACFGRPEAGLLGLTNNPNVAVLSPDTYSGQTLWAAKDPIGIVADLAKLANYVVVQTNQIYQVNTILMATGLYQKLKMTPFSAQSDRTVLEWFRANNPGVEIDGWHRLNTANAAGTGARIVGYLRDPRVLQEKNPLPFTQLPPQAKNLSFVVPCRALTAGVHIYQPGAVVYMDGAA